MVVDRCRDHGAWLDPGELEAIIDFVVAGGLETHRNLAREQEVSAERRRHFHDIPKGTLIVRPRSLKVDGLAAGLEAALGTLLG